MLAGLDPATRNAFDHASAVEHMAEIGLQRFILDGDTVVGVQTDWGTFTRQDSADVRLAVPGLEQSFFADGMHMSRYTWHDLTDLHRRLRASTAGPLTADALDASVYPQLLHTVAAAELRALIVALGSVGHDAGLHYTGHVTAVCDAPHVLPVLQELGERCDWTVLVEAHDSMDLRVHVTTDGVTVAT